MIKAPATPYLQTFDLRLQNLRNKYAYSCLTQFTTCLTSAILCIAEWTEAQTFTLSNEEFLPI